MLKVKSLETLGFTRHEALCALSRNRLNIEFAAMWLFDPDANNKQKCTEIDASEYFVHDVWAQRDAAIPAEAKHILAENAPLEDILWWYDELHSVEVEMTIHERLSEALQNSIEIFRANSARSNYGKLMERILQFQKQKLKFVPVLEQHAQKRLSSLKMSSTNSYLNCVVLGDASGSMEVAIESACIIASLLSVALSADLRFLSL